MFCKFSDYMAGLQADKVRYLRPDEHRKTIIDFLNEKGKAGWCYENRYLEFHIGEHGPSFLMHRDQDGTKFEYKFVRYKDLKPIRDRSRYLTGEEQAAKYIASLAAEFEHGFEPVEWSTWGADEEDATYVLMRKRVEVKSK